MKDARTPSQGWLGVALVVAVCASGPAGVHADAGLQTLRTSLSRYDLIDDETLASLRALGELASKQAGMAGDEARFLRAAAATDLVLLGYVGDDAPLLQRVASALGVTAEALPGYLSAELSHWVRGPFRATALEAVEALARLRESPSVAWQEPKAASAAKRDLIFLRAVRARIGTSDVVASFAGFSSEPCVATCEAPYAAFDATGRRAVATLAEAGRALVRLRRAAIAGDPFATALAPVLAEIEAELRGCVLRPMPRIEAAADVLTSPSASAPSPDLVLFTSAQGVRMGFVPNVALGPDGSLSLHAAGEPMLPETKALALPQKLPPYYLVSLPGVTRPLRDALAVRPQLRVALSTASGTDADLFARVLVSVRRVGFEEAALLGGGEQGMTSALQLSLLSKLEADAAAPAALRVRVHPASYDLRLGGRELEPQALDAQRVSMADVTFIPQTTTEELARALFRVSSAADAMRLLLPASALDQSTEFKRTLRDHPRVLTGS